MEKSLSIDKAVKVSGLEATPEDLAKINAYALKTLGAEDVFVFKVLMADNELDDRNFEPFSRKALDSMAKQYPGTPFIKDHDREAKNVLGRVFEAWVEEDPGKKTAAGETHAELHGKIYMARTESNKDLIAEIEAGIKSEVSTGVLAKSLVCSICGSDQTEAYCSHWPGRKYKSNGKTETCMMTIADVAASRELSLVVVPAQPRAGTHKSAEEPTENVKNATDLELRIRISEAFLKSQEGE